VKETVDGRWLYSGLLHRIVQIKFADVSEVLPDSYKRLYGTTPEKTAIFILSAVRT
jgi:hypothetical protein